MITEAIHCHRMLQGYADQQLDGISDAVFFSQPAAGINHPAWGLGHVAFYLDQHIKLLGGEPQLGDWKEKFGQGSQPTAGPQGYPSREEIMAAWQGAGNRLIAAAEAATPEQLAASNTYHATETLPTVGDFVAFSLSTHTAIHVGQISAWRRAVGRDPMF